MLLFTFWPLRMEKALLGALSYLQDHHFGAFPATSPTAFGLQIWGASTDRGHRALDLPAASHSSPMSLCLRLQPASQTTRHIGPNRGHPLTSYFLYNKQEKDHLEKAGELEGFSAVGVAGELHCLHPLRLHRVGWGLYPGAQHCLQDRRSTFPTHPHVQFSLNKGSKHDQQAITSPHSWSPHLEPSRLVSQLEE